MPQTTIPVNRPQGPVFAPSEKRSLAKIRTALVVSVSPPLTALPSMQQVAQAMSAPRRANAAQGAHGAPPEGTASPPLPPFLYNAAQAAHDGTFRTTMRQHDIQPQRQRDSTTARQRDRKPVRRSDRATTRHMVTATGRQHGNATASQNANAPIRHYGGATGRQCDTAPKGQ